MKRKRRSIWPGRSVRARVRVRVRARVGVEEKEALHLARKL